MGKLEKQHKLNGGGALMKGTSPFKEDNRVKNVNIKPNYLGSHPRVNAEEEMDIWW